MHRFIWDGGSGGAASALGLHRRYSYRKTSCCTSWEEAKARIRANVPKYSAREAEDIARYEERIRETLEWIVKSKARIEALKTFDIQDELPPGFDEEHEQESLADRAEAEARALGFKSVADLLGSPRATDEAKARMALYQKATQKPENPEDNGPTQPDKYDLLDKIL